MKDLRIINNRALDSIIIIDNMVSSFAAQLGNGIYIPPYIDQEQDNELKTISNFLIKIADVEDVRPFVSKFSGIPRLYNLFRAGVSPL